MYREQIEFLLMLLEDEVYVLLCQIMSDILYC